MSLPRLLSALLSAACLWTPTTPSAAAQSATNDSARLAAAERMVAQMQRGQFDSATVHFNGKLKADIPPSRLREIWSPLATSLGAVERVEPARVSGADVVVPVVFRAMTLEVGLSFDATGHFSALAIRPARRGAPTPSTSPPPPPTTPAVRDTTRHGVLFSHARFTEAAREAAERVSRDATDAAAHARLGAVALLENRPDDAVAHYTRARGLGLDDRSLRTGLAEAYSRLRDYRQATRELRGLGRIPAADKLEWLASRQPYTIGLTASVVHIPFTRTDPLPLVAVRVNGSAPAYFLIDTGAGETILDPTFATVVGARRFGVDTAVGFAGGRSAAVEHGAIDSLVIGGLRVSALPVRIQSTRNFNLASGGLQVDGIIGTGLFRELRATLDYPAGQLVVEPRASSRRPRSDERVVPMWLATDHLMLAWGRAGAGDSTLMLLDTGLVGATFIAPDTVFTAAGISATDGEEVTGVGGGGSVTARLVTLPEVSFAGITRRGVRAMRGVFPPVLELSLGFPVRGLISHEFLRQYAVTFDFAAMQIVLAR